MWYVSRGTLVVCKAHLNGAIGTETAVDPGSASLAVAEELGPGIVAQSIGSTFGAVVREAVRQQVLLRDGDPAHGAGMALVGLIWRFVWIGLGFNDVEVSGLLCQRGVSGSKDALHTPSGGVYDPDHGTGASDLTVGGDNEVLVARIAAAQNKTPYRHLRSSLDLLFLRNVPHSFLSKFADLLSGFRPMQPAHRGEAVVAEHVFIEDVAGVLDQPRHDCMRVGKVLIQTSFQSHLEGSELVLECLDRPLGQAVGFRFSRMGVLKYC